MFISKASVLVLMTVCCAATGCTGSGGQVYKAPAWNPGRPLGRILVIVPKYPGEWRGEASAKDRQVRKVIRDALSEIPGTTVVEAPPADGGRPVSESSALNDAKAADAQTVCIVTVGQFYGAFIVGVLPPGWSMRSNVEYALRLIDVKSGELLVDSVRQRSTGGYLAVINPWVSLPKDFKNDVTWVLARSQ